MFSVPPDIRFLPDSLWIANEFSRSTSEEAGGEKTPFDNELKPRVIFQSPALSFKARRYLSRRTLTNALDAGPHPVDEVFAEGRVCGLPISVIHQWQKPDREGGCLTESRNVLNSAKRNRRISRQHISIL
jgi:hypothetical protein